MIGVRASARRGGVRARATSIVGFLTLVAGVSAASVATTPAQPATASHPGDNGPILLNSGDLVRPDGTVVSSPWFVPPNGRFFADGRRMAYTSSDFSDPRTTFHIKTNDGEITPVVTKPGFLELGGVSTDGTKLVAYDDHDHIYVVGTNGQGWHEIGDHAVTTRDPEFRPGTQRIVYAQGNDLFLINADGSGKRQWTDECTYTDGQSWWDCSPPGVNRHYSDPSWSPDGSKVLVWVREADDLVPDSVEYSIGILEVGSTTPSRFVTIPERENGSVMVSTFVWSPDGTKVAFSKEVDGRAVTFVKPAAGGTARRVKEGMPIDWQPCPNGRCASWLQRDPSVIQFGYSNVGRQIQVSGTVSREPPVSPFDPRPTGTVTVKLERKSGASWTMVQSRNVPLSTTAEFSTRLTKPSAVWCRITARYGGNSTYAPKSLTKMFTCG